MAPGDADGRSWAGVAAAAAAASAEKRRSIHPPKGGVTISLRNSSVASVHQWTGFVHPERMRQYTALFKQACQRRRLPDFDVNINLADTPKDGFLEPKGGCFAPRRHPEGVP